MSVITTPQPFENLTLWERLQLFVGEGSDQGEFSARVEEMLNGGVVISQPTLVKGGTLLRENISVRVQVTRQDAVYQFHSTVKKFGNTSDGRVILTPPRSMERIQRRLFVRLTVNAPAQIAPLDPQSRSRLLFDQLKFNSCTIRDISGGGMYVQFSEQLQADYPVLVQSPLFKEWELPDYLFGRTTEPRLHAQFAGQGIEFQTTAKGIRLFGADFISLLPEACFEYDQRVQDRMVTRVFQEQLKLRQKGLL
jgi:hypothetical protein